MRRAQRPFLNSDRHGAGLMVMPLLFELPDGAAVGSHGTHAALGSIWIGLISVAVQTIAMLVAAGAIAWLIFACIGLTILRRAWINFDLMWSIALIATGAIFLALAGVDLAHHSAVQHHDHESSDDKR